MKKIKEKLRISGVYHMSSSLTGPMPKNGDGLEGGITELRIVLGCRFGGLG